MGRKHPRQATQNEPGKDTGSPPRNVHWGAAAGALLLGLGSLLRKRRRSARPREARRFLETFPS